MRVSATIRLEGTVPEKQQTPGQDIEEQRALQAQSVIDSLPTVDLWPDIGFEERERRRAVLDDIARRVRENGPRKAASSPERARQFMPFAALKGYDSLTDAVEHEING